uniref:Variant surface glycoprotein 1125.1693 n=1 Tax=Trypanosoma brucei TaxID=5691 RepID=A0A1J0R7K5_9TRYP|nr:variant surface glycoprotein 1125.1693 [Trypanosoma brucei]
MLLLLALTTTIIRNDALPQIHEAPKIINSACDATRQTEHVSAQIKSKIETAFRQIVLGKKTSAKLSVAAAASTGEKAVAYAALAASAAVKLQAAEHNLQSNLEALLKGAAAAAELTATEELVSEAADLSLEARPGARTATVSGTEGGLPLRFASFGGGKSKCDTAKEAADQRKAAPGTKGGDKISFAHLQNRPKIGNDKKLAALCGDDNTPPNNCDGSADADLTYFEITTGTLLTEKMKQYNKGPQPTEGYTPDTPEPTALLPRETYVTGRLNIIKQAEHACDSITFTADSLKNSALVTDSTTQALLETTLLTQKEREQTDIRQKKLEEITTRLYGKAGTDVKARIWEPIEIIPIQAEATEDNKATELKHLTDLGKLRRAAAFYLAKQATKAETAAVQKATESTAKTETAKTTENKKYGDKKDEVCKATEEKDCDKNKCEWNKEKNQCKVKECAFIISVSIKAILLLKYFGFSVKYLIFFQINFIKLIGFFNFERILYFERLW